MKTLSIEQMEQVRAGSFLACLGQVASGMEVLGSAAFLLTAVTGIGFGLFALGLIGVAATIVSDPDACD